MFIKPLKPKKIETLKTKAILDKSPEPEFSTELSTPEQGSFESLESKTTLIKAELNNSPDIIVRNFLIGSIPDGLKAAIIYVEGLTDKNQIDTGILRPLMLENDGSQFNTDTDRITTIERKLITVGQVEKVKFEKKKLAFKILTGDTLLMIEGASDVLIVSVKGWEKRSIEEPDTEVVIKGPRDGFTESIRTNTALIRRKLGHPDLTLETMTLGEISQTEICLVYLKGVVDEDYVKEAKSRISRIQTDGILGAGFIEQFIEDTPFSIFSTIGYTERPDVTAAKLLEGRIAILVDGTPVVNTIPMLFIENFQSPDDYNFRPFFATLIRWVRYTAFVLTLLTPALYVALTTFHQEVLPTKLLISMAAAIEGTPFPAVIEVLGMGLIFEILREAGIRLPRPIGQAVSIVGALVIGDATVSAGLVGAPTVIVVALTAISSFVSPTMAPISVILRFLLTILAGFMGGIGMVFGLLIILIHLVSLRSFGVPYLSPLAPLKLRDLKDVLIRAPIWALTTRPKFIGANNPKRQKGFQQPHAPSSAEQNKRERK